MQYNDVELKKIIHSSFLIQWNGKIIYIDPWSHDDQIDFSSYPKADYIFITHEHFDHCDPQVVNVLSKDDTIIVVNERVKEELIIDNLELIIPNANYEFGDLKVGTVPAYNVNKFRSPGILFHPKENNGVGYILNLSGTRIFHMGDTDNIPEFSNVTNVDVLLAPVSGTYVMTPEEAAEAVKVINPKIVVPIHWGEIVGGREDAEKFEELVECEVELGE